MTSVRVLLFAPVLAVLLLGVEATTTPFILRNSYSATIWVGGFGDSGTTPDGGGWTLNAGEEVTVNVEWTGTWTGRFWPRTGCTFDANGNGGCETGDCGKLQCNGATGVPPATLAEFTLGGNAGLDFYDVSNVDGFNIAVTITPRDVQGSGYNCTSAKCTADILGQCPEELRLVASGQVVGCKSACNAFNTDEYCCRQPCCGTSETCQSSNWPVDYPKFFKTQCPDAYSYAYDDQKSTWTCFNTAYIIQFG